MRLRRAGRQVRPHDGKPQSDVPGGVVNILTGPKAGMVPYLASHLDVNAVDAFGAEPAMLRDIEQEAAAGVKRMVRPPGAEVDWAKAQSPYAIAAFTEIKTVWHPKGL